MSVRRKTRRWGRASMVTCVLAATLMVAGVCSTAFASPRAVSRSAPSVTGQAKAATGGVITEQDYYTAGDNSEMVAFINQFEKQNPGFTVKRDELPPATMESQELVEAAAGQLPDLMMMDNPWVGGLASAGDLVPLNELGVNTKGLTEGAIAAGSFHGTQFGIGFGNNSLGLFYNKTMLKAAGVSPPTTWAQLVTTAKALTNKSTGVYGLEVAGYNSGGNATWQFLPFFWTAGGDLEHVNDAGGVAALSLYNTLARDGSMPASVVDYQQNDIAQQFEDQKAAMIVIGPWEFADFNSTKGLSWGVTSIPVPKAGMAPVGPLGGEVWVIPKTTPAQEALGLKLLRFLTSPASTYSWASQNGEIASQKSVSAKLIAKNPSDRIFAYEIEHAQSRTSEVGLAYPAIDTDLGTAIQAVILGKQSPKAALNAAEAQVQYALEQYGEG
ncbi:MAG: sugar ABC transporter substrate-binding protein [Acidimicrobiales bacterium]